jgi:para-aminobenzoate synthetase/4-amino-4-deoxychorismate lyase
MPAPPPCDPTKGVFETLLVVEGKPIELDAHLARLAGSLATVFSETLPADAEAIAIEAARGLALGRLRLVASPAADGRLALSASADPLEPGLVLPAHPRGVELRTIEVGGGFGAHKWVDRGLLERAEREAPAGAVPLLLDRDGTVLEASRANVFALLDGVLVTPAADGRIVPGITRRRVLELATAAGQEVRERPLTLAELRGAEEAFLTNSVRGVEPVAAVGGGARMAAPGDVPVVMHPYGHRTTGTSGAGPLTAALAAELRRRWLGRAESAAAAAAAP